MRGLCSGIQHMARWTQLLFWMESCHGTMKGISGLFCTTWVENTVLLRVQASRTVFAPCATRV